MQIKNLTTGYRTKHGDVVISSKLDAQLHRGTMTCLLGPNGSGKSTLLRTLCRFQSALDGQVLVGGLDITSYSNEELAKCISVVLTTSSHVTDMKVVDVVRMGRSPYTNFWGTMKAEDCEMVDHCIELVGVADFRNRHMQTLSDGERQKVMIAKALAQDTDIILLDEPTAFLDYPNKVATMLLLHRLAHSMNKTVFLSTHDMEHALQVSEQVWLLDKHLGLTTGTPSELSASGCIERYFQADGMTYDRDSMTFRIK